MIGKNRIALTALAATCLMVGAAGGITNGIAASGAKKAGKPASSGKFQPPPPPVHEESTVLNKAGTAFITLTRDNGIVTAVSGNTLTVHEGTRTVAFDDVDITVADDATVMRNGTKAELGDIKAGDRVHVESSSDGSSVMAGDKNFKPAGRPHGGGPAGGQGHP